MTIDWNAPLEAYHPDGRVVEVELDDFRDQPSAAEGRYSVCLLTHPANFTPNGDSADGRPWRIRNRTEKPAPQYPVELVERIRDFVCEYRAGDMDGDEAMQHIEATLPPHTRDLEMARDCVASSMHDRDNSWGELVRAGERDDCPEMRMVLTAIKRIRTQTQDVRDDKGY